MPWRKGYYLESVPTEERRQEIDRLVHEALKDHVKTCGFGDPSSVFRKVVTPEELDSLRRSMADARNPGTVTMAALYYAWITPESAEISPNGPRQ